MEVKIDKKSIKNWTQDGKASWHRFLLDFGGFLEPSGEAKSIKIDPKRHRKNDAKKKGNKMARKTIPELTGVRGQGGPDPRRGGRGRGF